MHTIRNHNKVLERPFDWIWVYIRWFWGCFKKVSLYFELIDFYQKAGSILWLCISISLNKKGEKVKQVQCSNYWKSSSHSSQDRWMFGLFCDLDNVYVLCVLRHYYKWSYFCFDLSWSHSGFIVDVLWIYVQQNIKAYVSLWGQTVDVRNCFSLSHSRYCDISVNKYISEQNRRQYICLHWKCG